MHIAQFKSSTSEKRAKESRAEKSWFSFLVDIDRKLRDDDFIKNFPGPVEDAIKAVQESLKEDDLDDDEFINNFPGPIEDAIKSVQESLKGKAYFQYALQGLPRL